MADFRPISGFESTAPARQEVDMLRENKNIASQGRAARLGVGGGGCGRFLRRLLAPKVGLVCTLARLVAGLMFAVDCVQLLLSVADLQASAGRADWFGAVVGLATAWLSRPSTSGAASARAAASSP
jgi:hypothetical protein